MKKLSELLVFLILLLFTTVLLAQESGINNSTSNIEIFGRIKDETGPLPQASVIVQGTNRGTVSDENGYFRIRVSNGETVIFKYLGKKDIYFRDFSEQKITVLMEDDLENLDEVSVKARTDKNKEVIGQFGKVEKKSVGFAVKTLKKDQLNKGAVYVSELILGRFNPLTAQTIQGETGILIVVDGVAQQQENFNNNIIGPQLTIDNWLSVEAVEAINFIRPIQATTRYGTLGVNGAIEIITKNNRAFYRDKNSKNYTDKFTGKTITISELPKGKYMSEFDDTLTSKEALALYESEKKNNKNNLDYYIDVSDFFQNRTDKTAARFILKDAESQFQNDISNLKAIAYKFQEYHEHKDALRVFNRIMFLSSGSFQSYRDLAQAYHFNREHKKAFQIYDVLMRNNEIANNKEFGLKKTIENEYENIINKHRSLINIEHVNKKYLERKNILDYRITIEWNDLDAEFILQGVDPNRHHFNWEHSMISDPERVMKEKEQGFAIEESFLSKNDKGEWHFNMQYLVNEFAKVQKPFYVKVTVFENFGKPNETSEIKVIRLSQPDVNVNIATIKI